MHNSYHNVIDQKSTLFSVMYNLGMYSLQTLTLSNNNVEFYFPFTFHPRNGGGKQSMDVLYDFLTTLPVNYTHRMPQPGHCMSRALFGGPSFRDSSFLLFPRHVVYNMATKVGLGGYLSDSSVIPFLRGPKEAAEWMAGKEREFLWPLLSNHYLTLSESHGANVTTGPEMKRSDGNSTHILFVHRVGTREMTNWEEFRDSLSAACSSRGYSFQFVNPYEMTAEEQILLSSRATVYVSVHGANFLNMLWMNPRATSLEIVTKYNHLNHFRNIAKDSNTFYLRYTSPYEVKNPKGLIYILIF
jgi:hypothetical protein